jgi:hypothetical protein
MENVSFAYLDAKSKSIVWSAYAEHFACEEIMEEGFNINSGIVYITLEMTGVSICSAFGQEAFYIVFDYVTGEEIEFSEVDELNEYLNNV